MTIAEKLTNDAITHILHYCDYDTMINVVSTCKIIHNTPSLSILAAVDHVVRRLAIEETNYWLVTRSIMIDQFQSVNLECEDNRLKLQFDCVPLDSDPDIQEYSRILNYCNYKITVADLEGQLVLWHDPFMEYSYGFKWVSPLRHLCFFHLLNQKDDNFYTIAIYKHYLRLSKLSRLGNRISHLISAIDQEVEQARYTGFHISVDDIYMDAD